MKGNDAMDSASHTDREVLAHSGGPDRKGDDVMDPRYHTDTVEPCIVSECPATRIDAGAKRRRVQGKQRPCGCSTGERAEKVDQLDAGSAARQLVADILAMRAPGHVPKLPPSPGARPGEALSTARGGGLRQSWRQRWP